VWIYLALGALVMAAYMARGGHDIAAFSTGGLFSMWVIALAFGQALFNHRLPLWVRVGLILLVAAIVYRRFYLESGWLSGWVPAGIVLLVIAALKSRRALLATMAVVLAFGAPMYEVIFETQVAGDDSSGNFLRVDLWAQALDIAREHLLLGTGVAGYAPYYMTFFPDRAMSTHSNYLDLFAQTGLIGSVFLVWLLLSAFRVGAAVRKQWPAGFAAGFSNAVLGGLAGVVVAMAFGDWLIPFVYNQTIAGFRFSLHSWLLLGALLSMQRMKA
jgi:O-antigen ligase